MMSNYKFNELNTIEQLEDFVNSIQDTTRSSFSGEVLSTTNKLTLFAENNRRKLSFPFPSTEQLEELYKNAQPASFGIGTESVLDAAYRSARTIVQGNFAINFGPDQVLLNQIKKLMIKADKAEDYVHAELYRVNIYGPGDFFKEHKDTPQTDAGHFGSLVFCLPTEFEGGALVIRDQTDEEEKFDWGPKYAVMKAGINPSLTADASEEQASKKCKKEDLSTTTVQFVAFASDMTHWVEPVTVGYRVTVTFHLFKASMPVSMSPTSTILPEIVYEVSQEVATLLEMKETCGLVGRKVVFPMIHEYSARNREDIVLKGGDARLFEVLEKCGVSPQIMYFYDFDTDLYCNRYFDRYRKDDSEEDENKDEDEVARVAMYNAITAENEHDDEDEKERKEMLRIAISRAQSCVVSCYLTDQVITCSSERGFSENVSVLETLATDFEARCHKVIFATELSQSSKTLSIGAHYGNEPSLREYLGNVCIFTQW